MRATAPHVTGSAELRGLRVLVIGVGKVGRPLVARLVDAGAVVAVSDVDPDPVADAVARFGVEVVDPVEALSHPCDVLSPCALGGGIDAATIPSLRCRMIVGSANNQLGEDADAERLVEAGITYAPDFLVNAGGLIHVADELHGYDDARVEARVRAIGDTTTTLLDEAERQGVNPLVSAERLAQRRIDARRAEEAARAGPAGPDPRQ
jgi:glutamate dehydrogenase/leucine dehydrogenase